MKFDPDLIPIAEFLLHAPGFKQAEGVMADKRVTIFKGESAIQALLTAAFAKRMGKHQQKSLTEAEAKELMVRLLEAGFILRATRMGTTRFFQPDNSRAWNDEALYAWSYEGSQWKGLLIAVLALTAVFAAVMYPLWPYRLRKLGWYVIMAGMGFIGLIMVLAVVRAVVFALTFFVLKPGFWLFPNLFEDCGFFESFVPVYSWHGQDVRPLSLQKKAKKSE